jgi:penicillin-binding protein 2
MFGEDDLVKAHKGRLDAIGNIILLCFALLFSRLWYLQVYKGKILYQYSLENRLRKEPVKAPRGMIFSRNNQLIINNIPRFDAIVTPQYLKNKKESLKKLSSILNMPLKRIEKIIKRNSRQARYMAVVIKKNITRQEVAIIETENSKMPGVSVRTFISREYADKEIGGHLLGYISEISRTQLPKYRKRDSFKYKLGDFIGQAGLEKRMDLTLRGSDGHEFVEVDARGRMKRYIKNDNLFKGIENLPALPGKNVRLTIDRDLQVAAYESLKDKVGAVVAVEVETGEILAMVSRPSFDPSIFSKGISGNYWSELSQDENQPLLDRTIQEHYAPGSTFKTITAIAALEEGIVDEKTTFNCKGSLKLGRRRLHCWKARGHGKVDAVKAIRESCDVYFYKIATKLDIDVMARYAKAFGLGTPTGINLPREIAGLIPTKEWKKKKNGEEWQLGETLMCAIGQSYVLTTPLQLAMTYATIANGGTLYKPHLIKDVFSNSGDVDLQQNKEKISEIKISDKTLAIVKKGLFEVVNKRKGTAWWHRGRGIRMSGKSGTSQVIRFSADKIYSKCKDFEYKFRHHGVFAAFAPSDNPKIAVAVIVEHGCSGSGAAAPVAKNVITTYMKKYQKKLFDAYAEEDKLKAIREYRKEKKLKEKKAAEAEAEGSRDS